MRLSEKRGMYKIMVSIKLELNRMVPTNSVVTKDPLGSLTIIRDIIFKHVIFFFLEKQT